MPRRSLAEPLDAGWVGQGFIAAKEQIRSVSAEALLGPSRQLVEVHFLFSARSAVNFATDRIEHDRAGLLCSYREQCTGKAGGIIVKNRHLYM